MTRAAAIFLGLLLPFAAHAQQAAPSTRDLVLDLFLDVARVFDEMGIPPDWDDGDLLGLRDGAFELTDPRTERPYRTAQGRPIPYYVFDPSRIPMCDPTAGPPEATVLFIGGVHPNEVSPLYSSWRQLVELIRYGGSPHERTRIVYVPLANPDAMIGSFERDGRTTRATPAGIDLNRDYGSDDPQNETRFVQALIAASCTTIPQKTQGGTECSHAERVYPRNGRLGF